MKKISVLTLLFAVGLWAADFWQAKLFTDWSDKEVQKVATDSPWAKQISVAMGGGMPDPGGKGGRSKGGGGGASGGAGGAMPNDITGAEGLGPGGGGGGGGGITFTVRWQSALPVKQALVKMKFGAEAGTSAEAKQFLDTPQPNYMVVISGLRGMVRGDAEQMKQTMMGVTELVIKGKEPIKPIDFMVAGQGKSEAWFAFPKTNPIVEEDKEVEFQCKVGTMTIKQKFKLKDMMFNGKLEL